MPVIELDDANLHGEIMQAPCRTTLKETVRVNATGLVAGCCGFDAEFPDEIQGFLKSAHSAMAGGSTTLE